MKRNEALVQGIAGGLFGVLVVSVLSLMAAQPLFATGGAPPEYICEDLNIYQLSSGSWYEDYYDYINEGRNYDSAYIEAKLDDDEEVIYTLTDSSNPGYAAISYINLHFYAQKASTPPPMVVKIYDGTTLLWSKSYSLTTSWAWYDETLYSGGTGISSTNINNFRIGFLVNGEMGSSSQRLRVDTAYLEVCGTAPTPTPVPTPTATPTPKTIYVDKDSTGGTYNGQSWTTAYHSINDAIDDAWDGDDIWVAEGTYSEVLIVSSGEALNTSIYGGFEGGASGETSIEERNPEEHETIITPSVSTPNTACVSIAQTSGLLFDTLTFQNGSNPKTAANTGGGAIDSWAANVSIRNCVFRNNFSSHNGGAIQNHSGAFYVEDCLFENNTATTVGGAISFYHPHDASYIHRCVFRNNSGTKGGAIASDTISFPAGSIDIVNSIFAGNHGSDVGGATFAFGGVSLDANHCSFSGNTTDTSGICHSDYCQPTYDNCIFWDDDETEITTANGSDPDLYYCCIEGGWSGSGGNNIASDPVFLLPWNGADCSLHLQETSPCIDQANTTTVQIDLEGVTRPYNNDPDIGAYEWHGERILRVDASSTSDEPDGSSWSLAFQNINDALNVSSTGDILWVAAGTYYERIAMEMGVHIFGGFETTATDMSTRHWVANPTILNASTLVGHVVEGANDSTLDGFTITGGSASSIVAIETLYDLRGGGIFCDGTSPTIQHCWITKNEAQGHGGGVCCQNDSTATFRECVILGNTSVQGKAGAIYVENSTPLFCNCTITGNSADDGTGGLLSVNAAPTIKNCVLWDNDTSLAAEGTDVPRVTFSCIEGPSPWTGEGNTNLDPLFVSLWDGNQADLSFREDTPCCDTGALVAASLDLSGTPRSTSPQGSDIGHLELDATKLIHIYHVDSSKPNDSQNGRTWATAKKTLAAAVALANQGDWILLKKGTHYLSGEIVLNGLSDIHFAGGFDGNENYLSQRDDGPTPGRSTIIDAGGMGRAFKLVNHASNITFDSLLIKNGEADGAGEEPNGGAIYCESSTFWMKYCNLFNSTATGSGGGIAIYNSLPGELVVLEDCNIGEENGSNEAIAGSGGGIYVQGGNLLIFNKDTTTSGIRHNVAYNSGGGIYSYGATLTITNDMTIANNTASNWDGGGVCVYDTTLYIHNECHCSNNYSDFRGGFLYGDGESHISISSSDVNGNLSYLAGGALHIDDTDCSATLSRCTFIDNQSFVGGGVYLGDGISLVVSNCEFVTNIAEDEGGGLYVWGLHGPDPLSVLNCTFKENVSTSSGGGGCYIGIKTLQLKDCEFNANQAETGGGFKFQDCELLVDKCHLIKNQAIGGSSGGGGFMWGCSGEIRNCLFTENLYRQTTSNGAALVGAGALDVRTSEPLSILNCTFAKNTIDRETSCDLRGAALILQGADISEYNCILWDNWNLFTNQHNEQYYTITDPLAYVGYCLVDSFSSTPDQNHNFGEDPLFRAPDMGIYRLSPNSPAKDAGSPTVLLEEDIDGAPRTAPTGLGHDLGAYELDGFILAAQAFEPDDDNFGNVSLNVTGANLVQRRVFYEGPGHSGPYQWIFRNDIHTSEDYNDSWSVKYAGKKDASDNISPPWSDDPTIGAYASLDPAARRLVFDLGTVTAICRMDIYNYYATGPSTGRTMTKADQYGAKGVKSFQIEYSEDGVSYQRYGDTGEPTPTPIPLLQVTKDGSMIGGNETATLGTPQSVVFTDQISARYIRLEDIVGWDNADNDLDPTTGIGDDDIIYGLNEVEFFGALTEEKSDLIFGIACSSNVPVQENQPTTDPMAIVTANNDADLHVVGAGPQDAAKNFFAEQWNCTNCQNVDLKFTLPGTHMVDRIRVWNYNVSGDTDKGCTKFDLTANRDDNADETDDLGSIPIVSDVSLQASPGTNEVEGQWIPLPGAFPAKALHFACEESGETGSMGFSEVQFYGRKMIPVLPSNIRASDETVDPERLIDGVTPDDFQSISKDDMWYADQQTNPHWIKIDLGRIYRIDTIGLWNFNDDYSGNRKGVKSVTVQVADSDDSNDSNDDATYVTVGTYALQEAPQTGDIVAQYIHFYHSRYAGETLTAPSITEDPLLKGVFARHIRLCNLESHEPVNLLESAKFSNSFRASFLIILTSRFPQV